MATTLFIILGLTALVIGLLGTIYPALPGLILMFVGAWLLGYADDYATIGGGTLTAIGIFTVIGTATDFVAGMLGAKFTGASKEAVWGSFFGGIAGAFFGIPGCTVCSICSIAGCGKRYRAIDTGSSRRIFFKWNDFHTGTDGFKLNLFCKLFCLCL